MSDHNTLPQGNSDAALTLAQLLATAVEEPIEVDTLSDLQTGPAPTAGRVAEVGQQDYYLGDGSQWVAASAVSLDTDRVRWTPSDLSGSSGSQSGEMRVDDGTNTTHGDPDACLWNGSAWRQVGTTNTFS
jgi:hypothetical protein